jgi:hypothetical protein
MCLVVTMIHIIIIINGTIRLYMCVRERERCIEISSYFLLVRH